MKIKYLIFLIFFITSCSSVNKISFNVLRPSEKSLPKQAKTIAFAYRDIRDSDNLDDDQGIYLSNRCYEGFYSTASASNLFSRVDFYVTDVEFIGKDTIILAPLNWIKAGQISFRMGAGIVVVLENIKIRTDLNGNISWKLLFRTYDTAKFTIIDQKEYEGSIMVSSYYDDYNVVIIDEIERILYSLGDVYAKRIIPHWEKVYRSYYSKGHKLLSLGTYYFEKKNYKNSILVWQTVLDKKLDNKVLYKACVNLSLAYELENKLIDALKYAALSLAYVDKENSNLKLNSENLVITLRKRIVEQKKLK